MTPKELRAVCAAGEFLSPTAGVCPGHVQANLVVLPEGYAKDFKRFCENNPKPCPLLEVVGPGSHRTRRLADRADLLDCIPAYRVWENGEVREQRTDIRALYTEEMVFFLLGCSFSFEQALMAAGIPLRHVDQEKNVAMFDTSIALAASGPFSGNMVVSMRPVHRTRVAEACIITNQFPDVHGAPVHVGYPEMIGIADINAPDYGDAIEIKPDEIPLFWACGVTPQNVLANAGLPFAITHAPGFMFVGDLLNRDLAGPHTTP